MPSFCILTFDSPLHYKSWVHSSRFFGSELDIIEVKLLLQAPAIELQNRLASNLISIKRWGDGRWVLMYYTAWLHSSGPLTMATWPGWETDVWLEDCVSRRLCPSLPGCSVITILPNSRYLKRDNSLTHFWQCLKQALVFFVGYLASREWFDKKYFVARMTENN